MVINLEMLLQGQKRNSARLQAFENGIKVNMAKIELTEKLPPPTFVIGTQSILGHSRFFR